MLATDYAALKPKDKKEYLAQLEATKSAWVGYEVTPGLAPEEVAKAKVVIAALDAKIAEVTEATKKRSSASKPKDADLGPAFPSETKHDAGGCCGKCNTAVTTLDDAINSLSACVDFFQSVPVASADVGMAASDVFAALMVLRRVAGK